MSSGWTESASAWITEMGERGDYAREFILDGPMIARIHGRGFRSALDVGCGEGRFCRTMQGLGIQTTGLDPTDALIRQARARDPRGDYRLGRAEAMAFADRTFDLAVSYLTLIDIPDIAAAISEIARVLKPGGTLLIANLTGHATAVVGGGWMPDASGELRFAIDHYLEERAWWMSWHGIRIQNWHRPLSTYMTQLLDQGLVLRHFAEPAPVGGDPIKGERNRRVPWFLIMEWQKPAG